LQNASYSSDLRTCNWVTPFPLQWTNKLFNVKNLNYLSTGRNHAYIFENERKFDPEKNMKNDNIFEYPFNQGSFQQDLNVTF